MAKYVHSFTSISEYYNCPRKMHEKRILKMHPFVETEATRYGNRLHKAFENRIKYGRALPDEFAVYEPLMESVENTPGDKFVEMKLGIDKKGQPTKFFGNDVWFRGAGDLVIVDHENRIGFYYDWKTGKSFKPQYIESEQLRDNALMMFAHFPDIDTVYAALMYTQHDKMFPEDGPMEYKRADFDTYMDSLLNEAAPVEESLKTGEWPENPNPLCGWCPCTTCPHWFDNGRK